MSSSSVTAWLKPSTYAGGSANAVGMPWEIYRSSALTPKNPHPVTLYSKDGAALLYRSSMTLADEYGLGTLTLTAGPMDVMPLLSAALIETFVPAVDEATREAAEANYARTFVSPSRGGSDNSSISASFILDKDSLVFESLVRDGKDVLTGMDEIFNVIMGQFSSPMTAPYRLFPSPELDQPVTTSLPGYSSNKTVTAEKWTLWPTLTDPKPESDLPGAGFGTDNCMGWTIGDWVHYGGEPLDRLVFYKDEEGQVVGFEVPFLRSGVLRPV